MNVMIINGSPKKKGGASAFFAKVLSFFLFPHKITTISAGISKNYQDIFDGLQNADAVVISVPLYVDSIPAHFIHLLKQMEQFCKNTKCKFMLYVISNAGFVGGDHNQALLEQFKCWCERANITWGGGLGIGGGIMLHVLFKIMLICSVIQFAIGIIINIIYGKPFIDKAFLSGSLSGFAYSMLIMLFLYSGMLFYEFIVAWAIKNKKSIKNKYTRVMLPSFIFIIIANIFMALSGLLHGKFIFSMLKKAKNTNG